MFERYTEGARRSLFFARFEAPQRESTAIESEHLLLGLIREDRIVSDILTHFHVAADTILKRVDVAPGRSSRPVEIPFAPEVKRILQHAQHESDQLGHRHIGTEHLFVALLDEQQSVAASILTEVGITAGELRMFIATLPAPTLPAVTASSRMAVSIQRAVETIRTLVDQLSRAERNSPEAKDLVAQIYRALDALTGRPES